MPASKQRSSSSLRGTTGIRSWILPTSEFGSVVQVNCKMTPEIGLIWQGGSAWSEKRNRLELSTTFEIRALPLSYSGGKILLGSI
jgi:hypothetical protein